MLDTMTFTKAIGALCGSLLVFLLIGFAGGLLFSAEGGGEHSGETQAYTIDTGAAAGAGEAEAGPSFEEVMASADPVAGEKVFAKCKACHKVDGTNGTGPHLDGVVGREHAAVPGFAYSDAMASHKGQAWTPEALNEFLTNPKAAIPGTKMSFAGLPKVQDRANLIAWLETQKQ
ncbi:MAG: cytochrome c family protein [Cereibacter sphaeroides]|uniref:Cytochrome c family protein n=1 Tax=Cereibacter sphaeroides TaxID=1063 RepID=A0A2W5SCV4_CERSP|nr:MAG: cytochrome c family protein [Cereibacter sphaeroides]